MTQRSERGQNLGRGEPAGALVSPTSREFFARLMVDQPQIALAFLRDKIGLMPADDPEKPGIRTTRIGQTPVVISIDFDELTHRETIMLEMFIDGGNLERFMQLCKEERLSQDFIDKLNRGFRGDDYRLSLFCDQNMNVDATAQILMGWKTYRAYKQAQVSSGVFAELVVDLLEPQGIGSDLGETDARPLGEPADAGAEAGDSLVSLGTEEAELARLIGEDPEGAWTRIEEILRPLALEERYDGQARIGGTAVTLEKSLRGLSFFLSGDLETLESFMQACGGSDLSEKVRADLEEGIRGDYTLEISASFYRTVGATIFAIIQERDDIASSRKVSPQVFAALMMRLKKSQGAESTARAEGLRSGGVQVYPPDKPAVAQPASVVRNPAQDDRSRLVPLFDRVLKRLAGREGSAPAGGSKIDEEAQALPSGGEAAPLTVEHLVALMRTNPRGVFDEIRRRIALKELVGPANIGRTPATVEIGDGRLTLSLEIDSANLARFMRICSGVGLGDSLEALKTLEAFKNALALGISGSNKLTIEASAGDSGVKIRASSKSRDGMGRSDGSPIDVKPAVFAELVGMLNPFDKSSTVRSRHAEDRYPHEVVISPRGGDKIGQGYRRKKR